MKEKGKRKEKMNIGKMFLFGMLVVFLIGCVNANVIGGEVFATDGVDPSWYTVNVYENGNPTNFVDALVSPEGYRYSFLNAEGEGAYKFGVGKEIVAKIVDFSAGVMADPIYVISSGEDYDIFSPMELREVVLFNSPKKNFFVNEDTVEFEFNVLDNCDFGIYENESQKILCEEGCDYSSDYSLDYGKNFFEFYADCDTGENYKYFSNEQFREYADTSFKELELVDGKMIVKFYGNKTWSGKEVYDFSPSDFLVLDVSHDGVSEEVRGGYNVINWIEDESVFNFSYEITPSETLERCEYGLIHKDDDSKIILSSEFVDGIYDLKEYLFYVNCNFSKKIEMTMVESVSFSETLPDKLRKDFSHNVNLDLDLSHNVSGLEMREYVPLEFEVSSVSNGGRVVSSSSDYNVIIWDLDGNNFDFSYTIKSGANGEFFFKSEIEDYLLSEKNVEIYSVGSSGGGSRKGNKNYEYNPVNFSKVGPGMPIVKKKDNFTVAVDSNEFIDRGAMDVYMFKPAYVIYSRAVRLLGSYLIENNLGENTNELSFEYEVPKGKYSDVEFYGVKKNGGIFRMSGQVVEETDESLVYGSYSNRYVSRVLVYGKKISRNFYDRFVDYEVDLLLKISDFLKAKIL